MLVLNASYEPINVCNIRRATVLVLKERAEIIERGEGALHSERLVFDRPCVIRLVRYIRIPRDVHRRKITRKAVLARDAWTCQYCGHQAAGLTVDHVIPRSRGGRVGVGEHRRLLRALQPEEGQPDAAGGADAPPQPSAPARPDRLHSPCQPQDPDRLGAVSGRCLNRRAPYQTNGGRGTTKGRLWRRPFAKVRLGTKWGFRTGRDGSPPPQLVGARGGFRRVARTSRPFRRPRGTVPPAS